MPTVPFLGSYGDISGSGLMFRNRVLNGDMRIDQRNSGTSVAAANAYTLDRWAALASSTPSFSIQQNAASITPPSGFSNYLGCTVTNPLTPSASQRFSIQQSIEGLNVADLGWGTSNAKPVAISFWARSSLTGSFGGVIRNSAGNRCYPFTYSITAANTWEYKTVIISGDTSGTWLTNNGVGLSLVFSLGAGSALSGTAGAWSSSDLWSASGTVNVVSSTNATLYLTGVQLEAGPQATPFEQRPIGTELILCERYFALQSSAFINGSYASSSNKFYSGMIPYRVMPRSIPNLSVFSGTAKWSMLGVNIVSSASNTGLSIINVLGNYGFFLEHVRQAAGSQPVSGGSIYHQEADLIIAISAEL